MQSPINRSSSFIQMAILEHSQLASPSIPSSNRRESSPLRAVSLVAIACVACDRLPMACDRLPFAMPIGMACPLLVRRLLKGEIRDRSLIGPRGQEKVSRKQNKQEGLGYLRFACGREERPAMLALAKTRSHNGQI